MSQMRSFRVNYPVDFDYDDPYNLLLYFMKKYDRQLFRNRLRKTSSKVVHRRLALLRSEIARMEKELGMDE